MLFFPLQRGQTITVGKHFVKVGDVAEATQGGGLAGAVSCGQQFGGVGQPHFGQIRADGKAGSGFELLG